MGQIAELRIVFGTRTEHGDICFNSLTASVSHSVVGISIRPSARLSLSLSVFVRAQLSITVVRYNPLPLSLRWVREVQRMAVIMSAAQKTDNVEINDDDEAKGIEMTNTTSTGEFRMEPLSNLLSRSHSLSVALSGSGVGQQASKAAASEYRHETSLA